MEHHHIISEDYGNYRSRMRRVNKNGIKFMLGGIGGFLFSMFVLLPISLGVGIIGAIISAGTIFLTANIWNK